MAAKPVIFLAFANDKVDDAAYLRNLPKELDGIRNALQPAVKAGLCEVVERASATIDHILDIFQDPYYKDRVAIFHYGGHANGYQLLLETLDGQHASAHSAGLVSFLSRQRGLQLAFLNGCSSQQQALELVQAGLPAVIGTSQSIADDVATRLSVRFYRGLASGHELDKAWQEAVDEVKIHKGTANMRDLFWEDAPQEAAADTFPWNLHYRQGAEVVRQWNLPEAVGNPLFGLPDLPLLHDLPERPYRFLQRYAREHAELFFGRSYYIRELYQRATDQSGAPIILFHGQSGVGKSSMLDAGLLPRLEQVVQVVYVRRDARVGLLGTLRRVLGLEEAPGAPPSLPKPADPELETLIGGLRRRVPEAGPEARKALLEAIGALQEAQSAKPANAAEGPAPASLLEAWKAREAAGGKPLVVLLDQVEEVYTRPNPELPGEVEQALAEVQALFGNVQDRPAGKLILSYRKEYHPEIDEALKKLRLPREQVFLRKLDRRDIAEVVKGLASTERLRRRYRLTLEEDLPYVIADDLLADRESPIAPILQILLTKMWQLASAEESPHFSVSQYNELKRQGILMDDFFHEQMEQIARLYPGLVASGLALDVLYYHTTTLGTADTHSLEALRRRYADRQETVDALVSSFKDLYLLTDAGPKATGLAHDTLAPIVQQEFRKSDLPGQRATIILESKAQAYQGNPDTVIDADDLRVVEEGAGGMRLWVRQEEELIEKSRKRRERLEAERRRNRRIIRGLGVGVAVGLVVALVQWYQADRRAKAGMLAAQALQAEELDPTLAVRLAERAYRTAPSANHFQILNKIVSEHEFYKVSMEGHTNRVLDVAIAPGNAYMATVGEDSTVCLWEMDGRRRATAKHGGWIFGVAISPDGQRVAMATADATLKVWDDQLRPLLSLQLQGENFTATAFSGDGERLAATTEAGHLGIWNRRGELLAAVEAHAGVATSLRCDPVRGWWLTTGFDGMVKAWDMDGQPLFGWQAHEGVSDGAITLAQRDVLVTSGSDGQIKQWGFEGNLMGSASLPAGQSVVLEASPDGTSYFCAGDYPATTVEQRSLNGEIIRVFEGHAKSVVAMAFSEDGRYMLTGSRDHTAKLWELGGRVQAHVAGEQQVRGVPQVTAAGSAFLFTNDSVGRLYGFDGKPLGTLEGHRGEILCGAASPDGKWLATGGVDSTARLWDGAGKMLARQSFHAEVVRVAVSADGQYWAAAPVGDTIFVYGRGGKELGRLAGHRGAVTGLQFSADGGSLLSSSYDSTVRVWDVAKGLGRILPDMHGESVSGAQLLPDGTVVSCAWDGTAKHYTQEGRLLQTFRIGEEFASAVAFHAGSGRVAVGSFGMEAGLFDARAGNLLQRMRGNAALVGSVAFSPDGRFLVTASSDAAAIVWHADPFDFLGTGRVAPLPAVP